VTLSKRSRRLSIWTSTSSRAFFEDRRRIHVADLSESVSSLASKRGMATTESARTATAARGHRRLIAQISRHDGTVV
jgi:hypothetical protein